MVNDRTWGGDEGVRFAEEVRAAMATGLQIMLMQELDPDKGGCEFARMFQAGVTPPDLIKGGAYASIAAPFHPGKPPGDTPRGPPRPHASPLGLKSPPPSALRAYSPVAGHREHGWAWLTQALTRVQAVTAR